jgi:hypothetical protein
MGFMLLMFVVCRTVYFLFCLSYYSVFIWKIYFLHCSIGLFLACILMIGLYILINNIQ